MCHCSGLLTKALFSRENKKYIINLLSADFSFTQHAKHQRAEQTRTVFSEANVCLPPVWTDLLLKKVVSIIYLFFFFFFACVWSMAAIFQNLSPSVTLKMESRSPKSNQFLSLSQQYSCTSLVKTHQFILEKGSRKAIFQQSEPSCDLENEVKVTKI